MNRLFNRKSFNYWFIGGTRDGHRIPVESHKVEYRFCDMGPLTILGAAGSPDVPRDDYEIYWKYRFIDSSRNIVEAFVLNGMSEGTAIGRLVELSNFRPMDSRPYARRVNARSSLPLDQVSQANDNA